LVGLGHHPRGVKAEIIGHEHAGASADLIEQSGTAASPGELPAMFPRAGTESTQWCGKSGDGTRPHGCG
jgi:hypothetical protein